MADTELRSVFYKVFVRDKGCCQYCGKNLISDFDAFASMHLDHLKPAKTGGSDNSIFNRVSACGVCNSLKGAFDPSPTEEITESTFDDCLARARNFVRDKRAGAIDNSYFRDWKYWVDEFKRMGIG